MLCILKAFLCIKIDVPWLKSCGTITTFEWNWYSVCGAFCVTFEIKNDLSWVILSSYESPHIIVFNINKCVLVLPYFLFCGQCSNVLTKWKLYVVYISELMLPICNVHLKCWKSTTFCCMWNVMKGFFKTQTTNFCKLSWLQLKDKDEIFSLFNVLPPNQKSYKL